MSTKYQFSSNPQAVVGRRKVGIKPPQTLYRNEEDREIKEDPRVKPAGGSGKFMWLRNANPNTDETVRELLLQASRIPVDYSSNLVEKEQIITLADMTNQTAPFLHQPPPLKYIPKKRGVDRGTQIEEADHLFNFDVEVEPIIDILVSKTLDQSLAEVNEEEEMKYLLHKKQQYLDEKALARQLEKERERVEVAKWHEKEHRKADEIKRLTGELLVCEKSAAVHTFSSGIGARLQLAVFDKLEGTELFPDELKVAIESIFVPWLETRVEEELNKKRIAHSLMEDIIKHSLVRWRKKGLEMRQKIFERRVFEQHQMEIADIEAKVQIEKEMEAKKAKIKVFLRGNDVVGENELGPIELSLHNTVAEAEELIEAWIQEHNHDLVRPDKGFLQLVLPMEQSEETSSLFENQNLTLKELPFFHLNTVSTERNW